MKQLINAIVVAAIIMGLCLTTSLTSVAQSSSGRWIPYNVMGLACAVMCAVVRNQWYRQPQS